MSNISLRYLKCDHETLGKIEGKVDIIEYLDDNKVLVYGIDQRVTLICDEEDLSQ